MDWKLLGSTFLVIFIAELGDKTQIATLGMAASAESRLTVFLGASLALIATSAIAVLLGEIIGRSIPELWLQRGAGVVFLLLGGLYLSGRG